MKSLQEFTKTNRNAAAKMEGQRRVYKCRKCGLPKKGHVCTYDESTAPAVAEAEHIEPSMTKAKSNPQSVQEEGKDLPLYFVVLDLEATCDEDWNRNFYPQARRSLPPLATPLHPDHIIIIITTTTRRRSSSSRQCCGARPRMKSRTRSRCTSSPWCTPCSRPSATTSPASTKSGSTTVRAD